MKRLNIVFGLIAGFFTGNLLAAESIHSVPVKVIPEAKHDTSEPLKDMALITEPTIKPFHREIPLHTVPLKIAPSHAPLQDEAIQTAIGLPLDKVLTPGLNFLGLGVGFPGYAPTIFPPDPNASVGLTQIVEWINLVLCIDKRNHSF